MRAKAFNPQVFLELLCYLVFGGFIMYLVSSGKYLSYITPRMKPYLYFTVIVMFMWACMCLRRLFIPQYKIRTYHCLVLVIPILFILLPHNPLSSADLYASSKWVNTFGNNTSSGDSLQTNNTLSNTTDSILSDTKPELTDYAAKGLHGLDTISKKITIGNDEFYPWISEIYNNTDKYEDYSITITGYVLNDPKYFANNEFIPARLAMTCCNADLAPLGILCKYDKAYKLKADSWVTVEGIIHKGRYKGQVEPQIFVTKIIPAKKVDGYIYPF